MDDTLDETSISAITRPHPSLLRYYLLSSLLWGPLCLIPLVVRTLRYRTLRYQFTEEGVTMRWGGLTHHEVSLAYSRIQDIHVRSNLLERWLGLARIDVQTAGGSGRPELTLEGLRAVEHVRAFLYERARRHDVAQSGEVRQWQAGDSRAGDDAAIAAALREAAVELRLMTQLLQAEQQRVTEVNP
jgi:putative membrane protein